MSRSRSALLRGPRNELEVKACTTLDVDECNFRTSSMRGRTRPPAWRTASTACRRGSLVGRAWKWLARTCLQTGQLSRTCVRMPVMAGIRGLTGWVGVVLNAPDARALAHFYRDLFGWSLTADEQDWCTMRIPQAPANLAFQTETLYKRPTWPATTGKAPRHRCDRHRSGSA
jgi:hypothetical protein